MPPVTANSSSCQLPPLLHLTGPVLAETHAVTGTSSDEQKAKMIAETTKILCETLVVSTLPLYVTFDETSATAWGYNGTTIAAILART